MLCRLCLHLIYDPMAVTYRGASVHKSCLPAGYVQRIKPAPPAGKTWEWAVKNGQPLPANFFKHHPELRRFASSTQLAQ